MFLAYCPCQDVDVAIKVVNLDDPTINLVRGSIRTSQPHLASPATTQCGSHGSTECVWAGTLAAEFTPEDAPFLAASCVLLNYPILHSGKRASSVRLRGLLKRASPMPGSRASLRRSAP